MSDEIKAPLHKHEVTITLGYNDWDTLCWELEDLLKGFMADGPRNSFGAGRGGSYSVECGGDPKQTESRHRTELAAWMETQNLPIATMDKETGNVTLPEGMQ